MNFRIETSAEAELDAAGILEWLTTQQAGGAGLRWFFDFEEAIEVRQMLDGRQRRIDAPYQGHVDALHSATRGLNVFFKLAIH